MIVIVDYGIGNLQSIVRAFAKVGTGAVLSADAAILDDAEKIVLPGVGSFAWGMRHLEGSGLLPVLTRKVRQEKTPLLGICLGFQLLTHRSEEGDAQGLGWIDGETKRFRFDGAGDRQRVPHIGWNDLAVERDHPMLQGLPESPCFYFVHSYYVTCSDPEAVLARTEYGHPFVSVVQKGNIVATQFHPEKSHANGLRLIRNFVEVPPP